MNIVNKFNKKTKKIFSDSSSKNLHITARHPKTGTRVDLDFPNIELAKKRNKYLEDFDYRL